MGLFLEVHRGHMLYRLNYRKHSVKERKALLYILQYEERPEHMFYLPLDTFRVDRFL